MNNFFRFHIHVIYKAKVTALATVQFLIEKG